VTVVSGVAGSSGAGQTVLGLLAPLVSVSRFVQSGSSIDQTPALTSPRGSPMLYGRLEERAHTAALLEGVGPLPRPRVNLLRSFADGRLAGGLIDAIDQGAG
jgi:hypothetical protein